MRKPNVILTLLAFVCLLVLCPQILADDDEGAVASLDVILAQQVHSSQANMPGLVGVICEGEDFDRPASIDIIKHTNHNWTGGPGNWSGYWQGYIEAPATGEITFTAEADNGVKLAVDKKVIIDGLDRRGTRVGSISMVKGKKYPVYLWYFQDGDPSYLRIYWSWAGQEKTIIDEDMYSYGPADTKFALDMLPIDYWSDEDAPLRYDGSGSEPLDLAYQDGRLNPVVGVENYQVARSNREHPELVGGLNKTYLHAPMLCYWKGKFYLEFLAAPVNEHDPNTETYMTTSVDGKNWAPPKKLFPAFKPYDDKNLTICHQRMGFYISKNNRLLIMAFYGKYPSPNEGDGIGRTVREVYEDGSVGPLYFIRFNRHAGYNETNTTVFPYYTKSPDKGFVAICDELMANKLMVQQWWEEDRSKDGFYALNGEGFACKAFIWYKRNDGVTVGLFKAGYSAYSKDDGKTWSENKPLPSIIVGHAKMWGQRTDDGKFAFVYNPHFEWRYPLVVCTSDDGRDFSNMASVHGELNPMRYRGSAKDVGPQYNRGIVPGNGNPPGDDMWLTYSQHKEDIWVSRIPVPVRSKVDKWPGRETFNKMTAGGPVTDWNIYSSIWAPVNVVDFPGAKNKSLKLSDKEPYDYAKAMRIFPSSSTVTAKFSLYAEQNDTGSIEIEVVGYKGVRPVRIVLNDKSDIQVVDGKVTKDVGKYEPGKWLKFVVKADVAKGTFSVSVNRKSVIKGAAFAENTKDLQRLSFRTGAYRKLGIGKDENEDDLPNGGEAVKEAVFYLDNVSIKK